MALSPTSTTPLRLAIEAEISGITPTNEKSRSHRWKLERRIDHVPTTEPRHFHVMFDAPLERPDGLQGGTGLEYEQEMTVTTSYGGFDQYEARDIAADDNNDLRDVLRLAGVEERITGLIDVADPDMNVLEDDDGSILVEHVFTVRSMRQNRK